MFVQDVHQLPSSVPHFRRTPPEVQDTEGQLGGLAHGVVFADAGEVLCREPQVPAYSPPSRADVWGNDTEDLTTGYIYEDTTWGYSKAI